MYIDIELDKLAKDLCAKYSPNCRGCPDCVAKDDAKALIDKGYRKATEVAREIFEEIDTLLQLGRRYNMMQGDYYTFELRQSIAELKKKYTEGEGTE